MNKTTTTTGLIYFVHLSARVFLPLMIGAIIYTLLGQTNIRLVSWAMEIPFIQTLRDTASQSSFPDWLIYNAPDGLWLFALLQLMDIIWKDNTWASIWVVISVILAMGHEFGQQMGYFSGVYDLLDILTYAIATILSVIINRNL